jgi:hypothetical protein
VKVAVLQEVAGLLVIDLLRAPFHDQAKELTLADLAKEQRVEQPEAASRFRYWMVLFFFKMKVAEL